MSLIEQMAQAAKDCKTHGGTDAACLAAIDAIGGYPGSGEIGKRALLACMVDGGTDADCVTRADAAINARRPGGAGATTSAGGHGLLIVLGVAAVGTVAYFALRKRRT